MSDAALPLPDRKTTSRSADRFRGESLAMRIVLIAVSLAFLLLFLFLPLLTVFVEAGAKGWAAY